MMKIVLEQLKFSVWTDLSLFAICLCYLVVIAYFFCNIVNIPINCCFSKGIIQKPTGFPFVCVCEREYVHVCASALVCLPFSLFVCVKISSEKWNRERGSERDLEVRVSKAITASAKAVRVCEVQCEFVQQCVCPRASCVYALLMVY